MLFSGGSTVMSQQSVAATQENIKKAINMIGNQQGGGGTELLPALKSAFGLKRTNGFSRTIIIATDGYVTVEEEAFDLIRNNLDDANMFAFGIGSSVNRHLIEGMAHVGMGEPFIVEKPEKAAEKAEDLRKMIQSPVLTQVKVRYDGFDAYDVEPVSVPDVLAERPVIVFGKWRGKARGTVTVSGISGSGKYSETIDVSKVGIDRADALKYLWARHRIMLLSDYNKLRIDDSRIKEVTNLGLKYNLLTAYTSFIAVDTEVRNKTGKTTTVKQPLPLPEGVSDYAVGGCQQKGYAPMSQGVLMNRAAPAPASDGVKYKAAEMEAKEEKDSSTGFSILEVHASGKLSEASVRNVAETNLVGLESCTAGSLKNGKITLKITIRADGTVKNVELKSSVSVKSTVRACIVNAVKGWKFAKSSGETVVTLVVNIR
jgi:Ca-activated chloride channel family protein